MASSISAPPRRSSQTRQQEYLDRPNAGLGLGLGLDLALDAEDGLAMGQQRSTPIAAVESDEPTPRNTYASPTGSVNHDQQRQRLQWQQRQQQQQQQQQHQPLQLQPPPRQSRPSTSSDSYYGRMSDEARPQQIHSRQPSSANSEVDLGVQLDLALSYLSRGPLAGTAHSQASSMRPTSSAYFSSSRPRPRQEHDQPALHRTSEDRATGLDNRVNSIYSADTGVGAAATMDDFRASLERLSKLAGYIRSHSKQNSTGRALPSSVQPSRRQMSPASFVPSPAEMSPSPPWTSVRKQPGIKESPNKLGDVAQLLAQARALAQPEADNAAHSRRGTRATTSSQPAGLPPTSASMRTRPNRVGFQSIDGSKEGDARHVSESSRAGAEERTIRKSRSGLITSASTPEGALGRALLESESSDDDNDSIEEYEAENDEKQRGDIEELFEHSGTPLQASTRYQQQQQQQQQQKGGRGSDKSKLQQESEGKGLTINVPESQTSDKAMELDALRSGLRFVLGCYDDLSQRQDQPGYGGISEAVIAHLTKERLQNFLPRDLLGTSPKGSGASAMKNATFDAETSNELASKDSASLRPRSRSFLKALARGKPSLVSDVARSRLSSHSTGMHRVSRMPTIDAQRLEETADETTPAGDGSYPSGVVGPSNRLSMIRTLNTPAVESRSSEKSAPLTSDSPQPTSAERETLGGRRRTNSNPLTSSLWSARLGGDKSSPSPSALSESNVGGFFDGHNSGASNGARSQQQAEALRKAYDNVARLAQEKRTMQAEMEELSQTLFAEANEMVRSERVKAAALEKELESLRKAMVAAQQQQQQQRNERAREDPSEMDLGPTDEKEAQMMEAVAQAARDTAEAEEQAAAWKLEAESHEERCEILEGALARALELLAERNDAVYAAQDDALSTSFADQDGEDLVIDELEQGERGVVEDEVTAWTPGAWPVSMPSSPPFDSPVIGFSSNRSGVQKANRPLNAPSSGLVARHGNHIDPATESSSVPLAMSPSHSPNSGESGDSARRTSVLPHREFSESAGSFYSLAEAGITSSALASQRESPVRAIASTSSRIHRAATADDEDESLEILDFYDDGETKLDGGQEGRDAGQTSQPVFDAAAATQEDETSRQFPSGSQQLPSETEQAKKGAESGREFNASNGESYADRGRERTRSKHRSRQRWSVTPQPIVATRSSMHMDDDVEVDGGIESASPPLAAMADISRAQDNEMVSTTRRGRVAVVDPFDALASFHEASPLPLPIAERLNNPDRMLDRIVTSESWTGHSDDNMLPSPISTMDGLSQRRSSGLPASILSRSSSMALPPQLPQPQSPLPLPPPSEGHSDLNMARRAAAASFSSESGTQGRDREEGRMSETQNEWAPEQKEQWQVSEEAHEEEQEKVDALTTIPVLPPGKKAAAPSGPSNSRASRKAPAAKLPVVSYAGHLNSSEPNSKLERGPFTLEDENAIGLDEGEQEKKEETDDRYTMLASEGNMHHESQYDRPFPTHDGQSRILSASGSIHSIGGHTTTTSVSGSSIFDGSHAGSFAGGHHHRRKRNLLHSFSHSRKSKTSEYTIESNETSLTTPSVSLYHFHDDAAPSALQGYADTKPFAPSSLHHQDIDTSASQDSPMIERGILEENGGGKGSMERASLERGGKNNAIMSNSSGSHTALSQSSVPPRKTKRKKSPSRSKGSILRNMPSISGATSYSSLNAAAQTQHASSVVSGSRSVASRPSIPDLAGDVHRKAPSITSSSSASAVTAFSGSQHEEEDDNQTQSPLVSRRGYELVEEDERRGAAAAGGSSTVQQEEDAQRNTRHTEAGGAEPRGLDGQPAKSYHGLYFVPAPVSSPPIVQQEAFGRKRNYGARRRQMAE